MKKDLSWVFVNSLLNDVTDVRSKITHHRGKPRMYAFIDQIEVGQPTECWNWTGHISGNYGVIRLRNVAYPAHRIAWMAHYQQDLSATDVIMHTCDNPKCCNPAHLRKGTAADNVRDMYNKGRQPQYTKRQLQNMRVQSSITKGHKVLTLEEAKNVRALYNSGRYTQSMLAQAYGVARSTISRIVNLFERFEEV